jgi:hypothetical protein
MANVILENRTKRPSRMLVLNLDVAIASVRVENRSIVETPDGKQRVKISTKSVPDSIRIPAGGESVPLPEKILRCSEVKRALDAREIRVKEEKPAEKAAPNPALVKARDEKRAAKSVKKAPKMKIEKAAE